MTHKLNGKTIAILVENGFEQVELTSPREILEQSGARTVIISPHTGKVKAWDDSDWGREYPVDMTLDDADAGAFDGLLVPGGVMSPDKLRTNPKAQRFIRAFFEVGKPVAAICHAPWVLIDAGVAGGRTVTSYPSLQHDLKNAGATWVDREVVVDNGLVTSRNRGDIPVFNAKMVEEFAEGIHEKAAL